MTQNLGEWGEVLQSRPQTATGHHRGTRANAYGTLEDRKPGLWLQVSEKAAGIRLPSEEGWFLSPASPGTEGSRKEGGPDGSQVFTLTERALWVRELTWLLTPSS